ncbi:hypothetical protein M407DRAFT_17989 [Tulasnella calospora MUT 4182]|uniref:Uncharacterized protein n=1 Tax=Tulasnella calospora MUT 4182 TaxID=1051891 RepID=A0A0C3K7W8_9AGAM|nr:hypothetical protein M407DRAFT_32813 [Tulasnella calospora MUT 4182]KIO33124.1 hypothetical protein M407DRAFT_17989 [Tulasnella calospora MUT 4182]
MKTGWFFGLTCAVVVTIVSSVLVARLWAVYERDRRVLALLVSGFLVIFIPAWIICFRGFALDFQKRDADTMIHNLAYLSMARAAGQKEVDKVWPLTRCFLPDFPKEYPAVIVASLVFESGVFIAMVYKMIKDKKKTRLIEAFYRDGILYYILMFCCYASGAICAFAYDNTTAQAVMGSSYFIGIKSMMCSHVILRLRSYFSHGNAIVDGRESDPFAREGDGKVGNTDSTEGVTAANTVDHEIRRLPYHWIRYRHWNAIPGAQSSVVPSTPDSEPSVDWTNLPGPRPRRSGLEDAQRRRRTFEHNRGSAGGDRSLKPPEAGGQKRERPKSMDERTTTSGVAEQGSNLPSGRMSLQGSSTTHLEMEELTLAGSREPRRPESKPAV